MGVGMCGYRREGISSNKNQVLKETGWDCFSQTGSWGGGWSSVGGLCPLSVGMSVLTFFYFPFFNKNNNVQISFFLLLPHSEGIKKIDFHVVKEKEIFFTVSWKLKGKAKFKRKPKVYFLAKNVTKKTKKLFWWNNSKRDFHFLIWQKMINNIYT